MSTATDFVPRASGPKGMRRPRPVAEMASADWSVETDMEQVAARAQQVVSDVRTHDPLEVLRTLSLAAVTEPARLAQIVMTLAVWVPNDEPLIAQGRPA